MTPKPRVRIGAAYSNPRFEERLSDGTYRWTQPTRRDDHVNEHWQRIFVPPVPATVSIRLAHALEVIFWAGLAGGGIALLRYWL